MSIRNRLRTNKQVFFKVDNRELLKFTDKSQFWLIMSTSNRYSMWRLTLLSFEYLDHNLQTLCWNVKCVRTKVKKKNETFCDQFTYPKSLACFKLINKMGASKWQLYCMYISWSLSLIVKRHSAWIGIHLATLCKVYEFVRFFFMMIEVFWDVILFTITSVSEELVDFIFKVCAVQEESVHNKH